MLQLARQFEEHPEVRYGLTALCIGLGQGGSVIWENPNWNGKKWDSGQIGKDAKELAKTRKAGK